MLNNPERCCPLQILQDTEFETTWCHRVAPYYPYAHIPTCDKNINAPEFDWLTDACIECLSQNRELAYTWKSDWGSSTPSGYELQDACDEVDNIIRNQRETEEFVMLEDPAYPDNQAAQNAVQAKQARRKAAAKRLKDEEEARKAEEAAEYKREREKEARKAAAQKEKLRRATIERILLDEQIIQERREQAIQERRNYLEEEKRKKEEQRSKKDAKQRQKEYYQKYASTVRLGRAIVDAVETYTEAERKAYKEEKHQQALSEYQAEWRRTKVRTLFGASAFILFVAVPLLFILASFT